MTDHPPVGSGPSTPRRTPAPYSDRSPEPSEAGPSSPAPAPAAGPTLPRPSSPYVGAATALAGTAAEPPQQSRSRLQRLRDADAEYPWKAGLRAVLLLAGLIGLVGTAVLAADRGFWTVGYGEEFLLVYALVPFGASFVWCAIVLLVPLLRRHCRPVHPGLVVGLDLVFWLGLVVALGTTVIGYVSLVRDYGGSVRPVPIYDSGFRYYYDDGAYVQAANGTWVYTSVYDGYDNLVKATATASRSVTATTTSIATTAPALTPAPVVPRATTSDINQPDNTEDDDGYAPPSPTTTIHYVATYTRIVYSDDAYVTRLVVYSNGDWTTVTPTATATATTATTTAVPDDRECSRAFKSCAAQDAYVDRLFHRTARDGPLARMAVVLLVVLLVLHFALFVWACVDTHRYNYSRRTAGQSAALDLGGAAGGIALIEHLRQHGYVMVPAESVSGGAGGGAGGGPGLSGTAAEKAPAGGPARYA